MFEGVPRFLDALVGEALEFEQVAPGDRAGGEVVPGQLAALVEQLVESIDVIPFLGQVGEPVQGGFAAVVGQLTQDFEVGLADGLFRVRILHRVMLAPSSWWKVKALRRVKMLTIGQLARYSRVPAKTIRFYHSIGLLPEPIRDGSGYRRYHARDAILLLRIRTLAEAGVPLARISSVLESVGSERSSAIESIDSQLTARIESLQQTRERLRTLADPLAQLPPGVPAYLELLDKIGLSMAWVELERDLWVLAFAAHPETAPALLADQHQAKTLPAVQQIYRDYDQVRDLDPDDPRLRALADRILQESRSRYAGSPAPVLPPESPIPALIQDLVNGMSPAWERLDRHLRAGLAG